MTDIIRIDHARTQPLADQLLGATYRIAPEAFWDIARMRGDSGYDLMGPARSHGMARHPELGPRRLGPRFLALRRRLPRAVGHAWELAEYVEADLTVYRYPTQERRDAATDCLAFRHWKHQGESWVAGVETVVAAPGRLRGPLSWKRLNESKEEH